jgi:lipid II:glycine glycyltransferase (peptidoglycan interpeptide bridge formation enzyme)
MDETAERDGFTQHDASYLEETFCWLERHDMARVRLAEHDGEVLAANMEVRYGDTVTYLYGASSSMHRQLMAPFALHWDAITEAQREGYRWYDFWGANPASKASFFYKKSWEGITRFKSGWGAEHIHLPGTWDLPFILPLYRLLFLKQFWRG